MLTPGVRLPDGQIPWNPGEYSRHEGSWLAHAPIPDSRGHISDLSTWTVTEHEDGTITASPSIRVFAIKRMPHAPDLPEWHGFLDRGVWREC